MSNTENILNFLNTVTEKSVIEVYLPSLKREVKFKPISTKQQKLFFTCLKDNRLFNTKFIIVTYEIIKENCLEPDIVNTLTIIDRLSVLLSLRKKSLGSVITVLKGNKNYQVDFEQCLERIKQIKLPENKTETINNLQFELQVPLLIDQYNSEIELRADLDSTNLTLEEALTLLLTDNISKIIKNINAVNGAEIIDLNYKNLNYVQKNTIIDRLPVEVVFELEKYLTGINTVYDEILTVETDTKEKITFNIAADFFLRD